MIKPITGPGPVIARGQEPCVHLARCQLFLIFRNTNGGVVSAFFRLDVSVVRDIVAAARLLEDLEGALTDVARRSADDITIRIFRAVYGHGAAFAIYPRADAVL